MKIILLKDVSGLDHKYDVKTVADGYGRNVLIPKGHAELATEATIKRLEKLKGEQHARVAASEAVLLKQLESLSHTSITLACKANEEGHLFASLKKEEIVKELQAKGFHFTEDHLEVEKPLKATGKHEIPVTVGSRKGTLTIEVTSA